MKYKFLITRSCLGNFYWTLISPNNKKLAESGMLRRYEHCLRIIKRLQRKLGGTVEYLDLEKEYEL